MHHALGDEFLRGKKAFTAEFKDPTQNNKIVKVLLDHVLVTTGIYERKTNLRLDHKSARIEHDAFEKYTDNNGKTRDDRPSDHRPVSATFNIKSGISL